jgi:DNA-binding response OmpR family regulator
MIDHDYQGGALRGLRILVIEDSWHVAFAIKNVLEAEEATVIGPAGNLKDAWALSRAEPCPIALVDINLNGEMAYDLMDELVAKGVKVIATTGYELTDTVREKVAYVLEKPFDPVDLVAKISSLRGR